MDDYQKFVTEYNNDVVSDVEKERIKNERHQNRFNYYNSVVATLALILSIIGIILGLD